MTLSLTWVPWFSRHLFLPLLIVWEMGSQKAFCFLLSVLVSAWFTMGKATPAGRRKATSCPPRWPETTGCSHGPRAVGSIWRNSSGKTGQSQGRSQVWSSDRERCSTDMKTNTWWLDDDDIVMIIVEEIQWRSNIVLNAPHILPHSILTSILLLSSF